MEEKYFVIHQSETPLAVLNTIPLLFALKKNDSNLKIIFITSELMSKLIKDMNLCDSVYIVPKSLKEYFLIYKQLVTKKIFFWLGLNTSKTFFDFFSQILMFLKRIKVSNTMLRSNINTSSLYHYHYFILDIAKKLNISLPTMPLSIFSSKESQLDPLKNIIKKCMIPNQKTVAIIVNDDLCLQAKEIESLVQYLLDASFNVFLLGQTNLEVSLESKQGFINALDIINYTDIYHIIHFADRVISKEHAFAYFAMHLQKPMLLLLNNDGLHLWKTALYGPKNYVLRINTTNNQINRAKQIFQHFGMLSYAISQNKYLSLSAQKRHYFYAICPILCCVSNQKQFQSYKHIILDFEKRGYRINLFYLKPSSIKSVALLINQILTKPYMIIHGVIPSWIKALVSLLMIIYKQEKKPVFFPFHLHEHINKEDMFMLHSSVLKV